MFLQIPRELRDQIYVCLFASTRITFGEKYISRITTKTMKPAPNSLAILRTCRQINQEAGAFWLGHVLFNFEHPEDLLDKLSKLPPTTLSQIRHLRTSGRPLMLQPIGYGDDVFYRLVWALKLLPGLRLHRLTVLGGSSGEIGYDTLDGLIKYGNGWRELRFITLDSAMHQFTEMDFLGNLDWDKPQPSTWEEILRQRDGADSGASITIYRSIQSDAPGAVMNPYRRQILEGALPREPGKLGVTDTENMELRAKEEGKEVLFVVKRGHAAEIAEQDGPPYTLEDDIRQWAHGMTWNEIRRQCIDFHVDEDMDVDDFFHTEKDDEVEVNNYKDVDEYEWDPVN
ncbi:hypothetical protein EPUS_00173 [Endocarpon pusillum Z07020]|uniref:F-box domain-containing protein n=1 Tax=Endocarpon pusillum (strain Z07020 / HMAS-L-300199) TaxID=1263415 RepID=U1HX46_ENDPU|nr:uncharacterized protein EPUS_00173 [Endocarpon pusillum Z07020]ERF75380.1 hypothetical protein EPUS_00173 [Endocarpon pusillum Z07020]